MTTSGPGPDQDLAGAGRTGAGLPASVAAQRSTRPWWTARADRAYPEPEPPVDAEAMAAELAALRSLLAADTRGDVAKTLWTLVRDLGGTVVPARLAPQSGSMRLDVSLGLDEPLLPCSEETSTARMRLLAVLPRFLDACRQALARLEASTGAASGDSPPEPHPRAAVGGAAAAAQLLDAAQEPFFRALARADQDAALALVRDLRRCGVPAGDVVRHLLAPAQVRVGHLWESGVWSVADEHAATAVTEAVAALLDAEAGRPRPRVRHVVLGCVEGEWHSLPARLAAAAVRQPSVRLSVLGPSLTSLSLERRLQAGDVDLLGLSCTMTTNLPGAARCIAAAHRAGVPVAVGGAAFGTTPRRAEALGADAWSLDPAVLLSPPPPRTRPVRVVPGEVDRLDAVGHGDLALVHDRLLATCPDLSALRGLQASDLRESLGVLARTAAAAVATDDPSVLSEGLDGLARRQPYLTPAVLVVVAELIAEAVEAEAPLAAGLLRASGAGRGHPRGGGTRG